MVKKSIYQEVGGLNEVNFSVAFNDVDFCIRVHHAGYRNVWTPFAELYHHESAPVVMICLLIKWNVLKEK